MTSGEADLARFSMHISYLCFLDWLSYLALSSIAHQKVLVSLSLVAQMVKNLPEMQKTRVQSLGPEDALKKGMASHSSFPWTKETGGLHSMGLQRAGHD